MKKINSNQLKNIAIICMIIDHIGYFFTSTLPLEVCILCRIIGRIAMPIFTFFLVQGFFYTKSLKKYSFRLFITACMTQIILLLLNYINLSFCFEKIKIIESLNILFSFNLTLIILRMIDRNILKIKDKKNNIYDIFLRLTFCLCIVAIYFLLEIDYGVYLPVVAICMYFNMKYKKQIDKYIRLFLNIVVLIICSILAIKSSLGIFAAVAYFFIAIYDNKRVNNSKLKSTMYYLIFPLQYLVIYSLALIF